MAQAAGTGSSPASPAQPSRPAGDAGRRFSDRGPAVRRPSIGQKNTHTLYQSPRQIATRKRADSPAPEACGGKNHVHSVNFAKKGFTFAADSCRISASFSGRTSFFCRTRRSYEFLPKNWQLPGPVHVWAQRRGPAGVRDPLGGHYSGRGQPLCPEPGGLQHSVGGGHGADHLDGVPHVFQEPVQAPGRECGLYEQGGLSLRQALSRSRDKEHKYFTCPNCRTVCRVPRGKGRIVITCPKCGAEIHGKS